MKDIDTFREYCLSKKNTTEDLPFDDTTLCFRVGGKIYAIADIVAIPFGYNLKCDPERAIELREAFDQIKPGWHMNKKHWNTITPDEGIDSKLLKELVDHSYDLIYTSLSSKIKRSLEDMS